MTMLELRLQFKAETGNYPLDDSLMHSDLDKIDATDMSYDETEVLMEYTNWLEDKLLTLKNEKL